MRAITEIVDTRAGGRHAPAHFVVKTLDGGFLIEPACYAGLIGDDEDKKPCRIAELNGLYRSRRPFEVFGSINITKVAIDNAVAVKECGAPRVFTCSRRGYRKSSGPMTVTSGSGKIIFVPALIVARSRSMNSGLKCQGRTR